MNRRDIELLSTYLDGELKPADFAKLEARLRSDPELASVLNDLRVTRTLLRKLPSRKAPRNFTLTRKMVGQNPPLPRAYSVFRFATTIATLLFFFTFGLNFVGSQMASQTSAFGMGGGGDVQSFAAEAPAMEPGLEESSAPVEEPAPAEPGAAMDVTAEGEPPMALVPMPTEVFPTDDGSRIMETPAAKNGEAENAVEQGQPPVMDEAVAPAETPSPALWVSSTWQMVLAVVAVIGALLMVLMRQLSARRWK